MNHIHFVKPHHFRLFVPVVFQRQISVLTLGRFSTSLEGSSSCPRHWRRGVVRLHQTWPIALWSVNMLSAVIMFCAEPAPIFSTGVTEASQAIKGSS